MFYVFQEWCAYDCGGMTVTTFESKTELKKWIAGQYTPDKLTKEIETKTLRIIDGEEIIPRVKDVKVIKTIEI